MDNKVSSTPPAWGSLDILEACGASDSGSNPGAGVQKMSFQQEKKPFFS